MFYIVEFPWNQIYWLFLLSYWSFTCDLFYLGIFFINVLGIENLQHFDVWKVLKKSWNYSDFLCSSVWESTFRLWCSIWKYSWGKTEEKTDLRKYKVRLTHQCKMHSHMLKVTNSLLKENMLIHFLLKSSIAFYSFKRISDVILRLQVLFFFLEQTHLYLNAKCFI